MILTRARATARIHDIADLELRNDLKMPIALQKVLAWQPIGALVRNALQRAVRIKEIEGKA